MKEFLCLHQTRADRVPTAFVFAGLQPIEYLWRNTKKDATHNKYFEQFQEVIGSVEHTLNKFAHDASAVLRVFGQYCHELGLVLQPNC